MGLIIRSRVVGSKDNFLMISAKAAGLPRCSALRYSVPMSPAEPQGQTIAAIERAAEVLTLFAESDEADLGVTEIATALGFSKAVVYRILSSFRAKGYIEVDEETRRYRLGPAVLRLGMAYLEGIDVRAVARPEMEALVATTNETATLSIRNGWHRTYIDQVTPDRDVKMVVQVGRSIPLYAGASSKAFLAFLRPAEVDRFFAEVTLEALTGATLTSERSLRKELAQIRDRGYAVSLGERLEGAGSVAAPILGHEGVPLAVMSVSGPVERFRGEVDDVAAALLPVTERLSAQLGHRAA